MIYPAILPHRHAMIGRPVRVASARAVQSPCANATGLPHFGRSPESSSIMMSLPEPMPSLTSQIARLAQRLGLRSKSALPVQERASGLQLPFARLPEPDQASSGTMVRACNASGVAARCAVRSGSGGQGPCPRSPDPAGKQAQRCRRWSTCAGRRLRRAAQERAQLPDLRGLRQHSGMSAGSHHQLQGLRPRPGTALPGFDTGATIELRQASWLGERLYWAGDHHLEAFASAVAYARLRGLEVSLPANVTEYRLDRPGLHALDADYHAVTMPAQAGAIANSWRCCWTAMSPTPA